MDYNINEFARTPSSEASGLSRARQTYSVHRDGQLLASNQSMLNVVKQFVRSNARDEYAAGRTATYTLTGSLGFKSIGVMKKGVVHWEG